MITSCITGCIVPKGDQAVDQAIDARLLEPAKVIYY